MGFIAEKRTIPAGGKINITASGFLLLQSMYDWSGWLLYFCSSNKATLLAGAPYSIPLSVIDSAIISNTDSRNKDVSIIYQLV